MLQQMGAGFAWTAAMASASPLSIKKTHHEAKAKRVIFLFLNGGLSQVDTFDPKPELQKRHGQPFPGGNPRTERTTGNLLASPFAFHRCGQSGIEVSEIFPEVGKLIDDVCVVRSTVTNNPIHESCLFMMNTGDLQAGRPSMGSWLTYGLGTVNQNLPGYVVLCPGIPVVGPPLWNSAFLPAAHQGTHIRNDETDPLKLIPNLKNAEWGPAAQRQQLDLLGRLNGIHAASRPGDADLDATIHSMEVAFRMQSEAPEVFDISKEPESTRKMYGEGPFARGCLLARRLVERGVRMVQVYYGNGQPWDSHDDIFGHKTHAQRSDQPMAALLRDLKQRGMLDDTLVIIGSEFGRTPSVENSAVVKIQNGRDHSPYGFSTLLAGGGIKGGMTYGATDDFGFHAVDKPAHVHDLHATALHLLGLDPNRLAYFFGGLDQKLVGVEYVEPITEVLA